MSRGTDSRNMDRLRLVALGRIPRCGKCPRFHSIRAAHRARGQARECLPKVPDGCTHEVCAPLAARYGIGNPDESRLPTAVGQG